jgi:tetratricopeptide (TPR) repeat protein
LPNGEYRFFDRPGRDPNTGAPLNEITSEVVQRLRQREALQESAKKEKAATQEAQEARIREAADLQTLADQAEKQFASGDYRGAKETCDQVLRRNKGNETCKTVRQRASVKIAQQLVADGQTQLQRGRFDEALWNAEEAIKLDPTNPNAAKLKEFALQMKPHALN